MFHINYDLARQLADERRAQAQAMSLRRAPKRQSRRERRRRSVEAEVVELTFAAPCEQERIGA